MSNVWLHRCAIVAVVLALIVIEFGAFRTGTTRILTGLAPGPAWPHLGQVHTVLAIVLCVLVLALALGLSTRAGWFALGAVLIESGIGGYFPILHAVVAPVVFSILVALALFTSEGWRRPPVPAPDLWPPLRKLSIVTPIVLMLQIFLGAAFRHNELGVWWHILNAMIVLLLIMMWGVCMLRQFPEHPALRPASIGLLVIAGVQVLLGFAVYLIILIVSQNNQALIVSGSLHVMTGSLTMAAAIVLMLQVRRADRAR